MVERRAEAAYGMGVVIVSPDMLGKVLTIEEKIKKAATGREKGQRSIPLETEVLIHGRPESTLSVTQAALAEVLNDEDLAQVGDHFHLERMGDIYVASRTSPGVHFKASLVVYSGDPDYPFTPTVKDESTSPSWMPVREVLVSDKVRPLASEVVLYSAVRGDLLRTGESRSRLFPSGFSLQTLQTVRDGYPDRSFRVAS